LGFVGEIVAVKKSLQPLGSYFFEEKVGKNLFIALALWCSTHSGTARLERIRHFFFDKLFLYLVENILNMCYNVISDTGGIKIWQEKKLTLEMN
jgi:hypothetical protein